MTALSSVFASLVPRHDLELGVDALDAFFKQHGGLRGGDVVEVCGGSGDGKSAFGRAVLVSVLAASRDSEVVVFDDGCKLDVAGLARAVLQQCPASDEAEAARLLERVHVLRCRDAVRLVASLRTSLPRLLDARGGAVRLLLFDNVASHFWQQRYDQSVEPHGAPQLGRRFPSLLKALLVRYGLAALACKPTLFARGADYLGKHWSDAVNYRLALRYVGKGSPVVPPFSRLQPAHEPLSSFIAVTLSRVGTLHASLIDPSTDQPPTGDPSLDLTMEISCAGVCFHDQRP